jgi:hypothetical protein
MLEQCFFELWIINPFDIKGIAAHPQTGRRARVPSMLVRPNMTPPSMLARPNIAPPSMLVSAYYH